ncbi:MAG: hypothetical protein PHD07_01030 [Bacteroidales bacterium]|nr:hypothetical protein [Bacteroidales bacterium]MDD3200567.1 hypothetical protein [Bacteroidales bacterium]
MKHIAKYLTFIAFALLVSGCIKFDPPVDENGNEIPAVLISARKFDTKIDVGIYNVEGRKVESSTVNFKIVGDAQSNLVNIAGQKNTTGEYSTITGKYNLYLDPAVDPAVTPQSMTFTTGTVSSSDNYILLPYKFYTSSKGVNQVTLYAVDLSDYNSSVSPNVAPSLPFNVLNTSDNIITPFIDLKCIQTGDGYLYTAGYTGYSGDVHCSSMHNNEYGEYGIVKVLADGTLSSPAKKVSVTRSEVFFSVVKYAESTQVNHIMLSFTGSEYYFFGGEYSVVTDDGVIISNGELSGAVPYSAVISNITVPAKSNVTASVNTFNASPFVVDAAKVITAPVDGKSASFTVSVKPDYTRYDISLKMISSNKGTVSATPTKVFQYRKATDTVWNTMTMYSGRASIYFVENEEYIFRTDWKGKWFTSPNVPTNPDLIEDFLRKQAESTEDVIISKLDLTKVTVSGQTVIRINAEIIVDFSKL